MSWGTIFGAAAWAVLALSLTARPAVRDPHVPALAILLLGGWAASNLLTVWAGTTGAALLYPALDAGALLLVEYLRLRRPTRWKAVISIALGAQIILHMVFMGGETRPYVYALALNVLFALQLVAVAWPSAHRLMVMFFNWLLVSPRDHDTPLRVFIARMLREGMR